MSNKSPPSSSTSCSVLNRFMRKGGEAGGEGTRLRSNTLKLRTTARVSRAPKTSVRRRVAIRARLRSRSKRAPQSRYLARGIANPGSPGMSWRWSAGILPTTANRRSGRSLSILVTATHVSVSNSAGSKGVFMAIFTSFRERPCEER